MHVVDEAGIGISECVAGRCEAVSEDVPEAASVVSELVTKPVAAPATHCEELTELASCARTLCMVKALPKPRHAASAETVADARMPVTNTRGKKGLRRAVVGIIGIRETAPLRKPYPRNRM
jgi:hypothetical protein